MRPYPEVHVDRFLLLALDLEEDSSPEVIYSSGSHAGVDGSDDRLNVEAGQGVVLGQLGEEAVRLAAHRSVDLLLGRVLLGSKDDLGH